MADDTAGAGFARPEPSAATTTGGPGARWPGARRPRRPLVRGMLWTTSQLVVLALGAILGVYGALLVPAGPRIGGTLISVGAAIALIGNLLAPRLAIVAAGRNAGITLVAGWLAAALWLSTRGPGGGVILPGSGTLASASIAYLTLGALAGAVAALLRTGPPRTGRGTRRIQTGPVAP